MKNSPKVSRGLGDKDQRILDAAKILFSRYGLKKTSIEEIAQAAGLGKGTVYLYFKSKDEIFSVLANGIASEFEKALEDALALSTTPSERLRAFIETRIGFFDRSFNGAGITAESILEAEASSVLEGIRKQYGGNHIRIIESLLDEGKQNGEFDFGDSRVAALAIYHVLQAFARPWSEAQTISQEEKVKTCLSILFDGVLKR